MSNNWEQTTLALPPRERRDMGMRQAVEKAERVSDGWSEQALQFLEWYAKETPGQFLIEDVRASATALGRVPVPPSSKAWGSVTMKAKRAGIIRVAGYTTATNSCAPKPLWTYAARA